MLKAGADKTSVNTAAVQNPDLVRAGAGRFGSQCMVVAIDAKRIVERRASSVERETQAVPGTSHQSPITNPIGRFSPMAGERQRDWMRSSGRGAWKALEREKSC